MLKLKSIGCYWSWAVQNPQLSAKGKSTNEKMVSDSEAGKTLKLLKSSEVHRLAYLFRNAHAIAN